MMSVRVSYSDILYNMIQEQRIASNLPLLEWTAHRRYFHSSETNLFFLQLTDNQELQLISQDSTGGHSEMWIRLRLKDHVESFKVGCKFILCQLTSSFSSDQQPSLMY